MAQDPFAKYVVPPPSHDRARAERQKANDELAARIRRGEGDGFFSPEGPMAFINRGIMRGAALGLGAETLDAAARRVGINIPTRDPEGFAENIQQGAGLALGSIPGILLGAKSLIARGATYGPAVGRAILDPFLRRPVATAVTEVSAGAGAGLGLEASGKEYGPIGSTVGGVVGGVLPNVLPSRLVTQAVPTLWRGGKAVVAPFLPSMARQRAQTQITRRASDIDEAIRLGGEESIATRRGRGGEITQEGLSPAQMTGDPDIVALEQSYLDTPVKVAEYDARLRGAETTLRDMVTRLGRTKDVEGLITAAQSRAMAKIEGLGAGRTAEQASEIYFRELETALQAAKSVESSLWDIPDAISGTDNYIKSYIELKAGLSRFEPDQMPAIARNSIEGTAVAPRLGKVETVKEMHQIFSRLRDEARRARSTGDFPGARIADTLADAVWKDLTSPPTSGAQGTRGVGRSRRGVRPPAAVREQLEQARAFTRSRAETFNQGAVGRVLGYAPTGERVAQPTEMLEIGLGKAGDARAAVGADELQAAAAFGGRDPGAAEGAISDYLRRRLLLAAKVEDSGAYSASGARTFLRNNDQLLNRYPGMREQMHEAVQAMESAAQLGELRPTIRKAFNSDTPSSTLRRMWATASPADRPTLRAGVLEFALHPTNKPDELGNIPISGERLLGYLRSESHKGIFSRYFTPRERTRLTRIAEELAKAQRAMGTQDPTIPGSEQIAPEGMEGIFAAATYAAGTLGARAGAAAGGRYGGASLRTAQKAAPKFESGLLRWINRYSHRIVELAVRDPEEFRKLMQPLATMSPRQRRMSLENLRRSLSQYAIDTAIPTVAGTVSVAAQPSSVEDDPFAKYVVRPPQLMPSPEVQ
jgi:hypothetical protein